MRDGRSGPQNAPDIWTGDGGAIFNEGNLNITDCIFTQNVAGIGGAISNGGTLGVTGSAFVDNASYAGSGVIENLAGAELTVRESRFHNNDGHFGGAIASSGVLLLVDSVLDLNRANSGGAIHSIGESAIQRSTVDANTAQDGGAILSSGTLRVVDSVFTFNGAVKEGGAFLNNGNVNRKREHFCRKPS